MGLLGASLGWGISAEAEFAPARFEILPLPDQQAAFRAEGREMTRWHFGTSYPRPFFFPFQGPSGESLTRMGHPGAQNHDHHRSVWFAHQQVNGIDFWSDQTPARIRQKLWYAYEDGADEGVMASQLGWFDGDGVEVMEQDTVAALLPSADGATILEIQITLRPGKGRSTVELGRTNFGFLAVRVAKTLSAHFGGGVITSSEGLTGEEAIFGKPARWMDYSGPVVTGLSANRKVVTEGITFFDHPENPRHPVDWHVRADGWMGAAFCLREGYTIETGAPLTLRYLLAAHRGPCDSQQAEAVAADFARRPGFTVEKSTRPHRQFEVSRRPSGPPRRTGAPREPGGKGG